MTDLDRHLPAIADGDAGAFAAWLAGAEHPLRRSLGSFAARVDVEAVLQEALLRVWQVAPRCEPDGRPDALLRLAHRIARNLALSELRRARVHPAEIEELERLGSTLVAPAQPDPLLRKVIQRCREALPRQPRRALDARLAGGGDEPDRAAAARAGMRPNTFLQNIGRARRALLRCLAEQGVDLGEPG